MTGFEYRMTYLNMAQLGEETEKEITQPAGEGWELVSVTPVTGFNVIIVVVAWRRPRFKTG